MDNFGLWIEWIHGDNLLYLHDSLVGSLPHGSSCRIDSSYIWSVFHAGWTDDLDAFPMVVKVLHPQCPMVDGSSKQLVHYTKFATLLVAAEM